MPCRRGSRCRRCGCGRPTRRSPPTPPPDADAGSPRGPRGPLSLLRESFAAINARFHLAGFCALADLLLVITADAAGDDPAYIVPVCMMVTIRFLTLYGILGLVFQAASGRTGGISFARYASALARPLLWLQLKALMIALPIVSPLAGLALFGYLLATGSPA